MSTQTFWNGVPCEARRVFARVGRSPVPTWWCAELEGQERAAVEVTYNGETFLLDDETGAGWWKVTLGCGWPEHGHSSLPQGSVVLRERTAAMTTPQVIIPPLCHEHQIKVVRRCHVGPNGPWRATLVVAQVLLFRAAMADEGITKRIGGDADAISLVLAELGCPGCANHEHFTRTIKVLRKGLTHAGKVSRGELYDEDFGVPANPTDAPTTTTGDDA